MNGCAKKIIIAVITALLIGWAGWVSKTAVQAAVDNYAICIMGQDITEIKKDVKDLKELWFKK